jgi:predicted DCC family thiol-disulfide oxidoreductase YuxK
MTRAGPLRRDRPLFIFDGVCVLCSTGVGWLMRHDRRGRMQFLSAQSELGRAIYDHLGMKLGDSYVLIDADGWHTKTDGFFRVADALGGPWRLGKVFALVPRPIRDWFYDRLANNRYRLFGTSEHCALLKPDERGRLVTDDPALWAQLDRDPAARDLTPAL